MWLLDGVNPLAADIRERQKAHYKIITPVYYGHKKLARIGVGSKFRASLRMLENIRKT